MTNIETSPTLMRLESFLEDRRTLSRDQFLQKHATPVLILGVGAQGALEDDGAFRTQQVSVASDLASMLPLPRSIAVVPISKRMADAFQAFIWVGRESRCDVALPFTSVSKLQAQFVKRPSGDYDLLDAGSTNGTFVDDVRLDKNKPYLLRDTMRIRFGKLETKFRSPEGFYEELGQFL